MHRLVAEMDRLKTMEEARATTSGAEVLQGTKSGASTAAAAATVRGGKVSARPRMTPSSMAAPVSPPTCREPRAQVHEEPPGPSELGWCARQQGGVVPH